MKKLPFTILNSNEIYAINSRIVEACKQTNGNDEYLMKLCMLLIAANDDLRKGLGRTFNSEFTSALLLADEKRDGAFIGLRDYIHACCNSGDDAKEEAAYNLSAIVEAVGNNLQRLPYATESTKLDVLFEKFDGPVAREALATITATDWLERLKARQADFEKVYQSKIGAEAGVDMPLVKNSKDAITTYLKGLFAYITTNVIHDAAQFGAIEEKFDGIITDAVTIARSRATRIENTEKDAVKAAEQIG